VRGRGAAGVLGLRRLRVAGVAETARWTLRWSARSVRSAVPLAAVVPPTASFAS
jgi:hypothetical protein